MRKMTINGKEILTNYGQDYPRLPDNMTATHLPFRMSFEEFLKEAVNKGYTRITFYYTTTRVRGYHEFHAKCR
jgi:hypothetical protein